jgi:hypothetical protein
MNRLLAPSQYVLANKSLIIGAALSAALFTAWPLATAAQTGPDPHHPEGQQELAPQPDDKAPGTDDQSGMPGGQGMMRNMMTMMQMMGGAAGAMPCMPDAATVDHIEGRLAFLHAELKISDAQQKAWNQFADRMRESAKTLGDVRKAAMMKPASGQMPPMFSQKLDLQERSLKARLDLIRAYKDLYSALSEDQKKLAEKLLVAHMGMSGPQMMMPMGGP